MNLVVHHRRRAEGQDPQDRLRRQHRHQRRHAQAQDEGDQGQDWFLSFITGRGTYKEDKYAEDAEKVVGYYRDKGYLRVRVDNPEVKTLEDSKDKKTRFIELRIPVTEGPRYRSARWQVADNKVVKSEPLVEIFKLKKGEYYAEKQVRKGLEKARETLRHRRLLRVHRLPRVQVPRPARSRRRQSRSDPEPRRSAPTARPGSAGTGQAGGPAIVDVTMHMQEGEQYFVNRITFIGNTTTRDNVIRREMRLVENGVFNTEALKYSVKRINQLGYFKQLEEGRTRTSRSRRRRTRRTRSTSR